MEEPETRSDQDDSPEEERSGSPPSKIPEGSSDPGTSPSRYSPSSGRYRDSSPLPSGEIDSAEKQAGRGYGKYGQKTGGYGAKSAMPGDEANFVKRGLGSLIHKPSQGIIGLAARMFQSKKAKAGGLIGGGLVVGSIVLIMTFSPLLRLDHLFQNINNRAFAAVGSAIEHRASYLFERYMILRITNMKGCRAVSSRDCRMNYNAGLATNMFRAWQDARVEEKLFSRMGMSIESTRNPSRADGVHRFTIRDRNGQKLVLNNSDDYIKFTRGQYEGGRREFGRNMNKFLRQETLWWQVYQRKQIRKVLKRKHNAKFWCFLSCKKKDAIEDTVDDSKTKYKYRFVERFVYPFSAKYGLILDCVISGGVNNSAKCGPKRLAETGVEEKDLSEKDRNKVLKSFENNPGQGLGRAIISDLFQSIMARQAGRTAIAAIPVAGQVYLALVIVDMFDRADEFIEDNGISKYAADLNASQYVRFYSGFRSDNDGVKKGEMPLEDLGVLASEFEGGEASKLHNAYTNNSPGNRQVAFLGMPSVSAQADSDDEYLCDNGKPIPRNEYVCEEKKIARTYSIEEFRDNSGVAGLATALNGYRRCLVPEIGGSCPGNARVRTVVRPVIDSIDWAARTVIGTGLSIVTAAVEATPVVGDAFIDVKNFATEKSEELIQVVMGKIFSLPVALTDPPRDKVDGLYAGADKTAQDSTQGGYTDDGDSFGQGAPQITTGQMAAIYQEQMEQEEYEFKNSGFINRIADIEEPDSLVSRVASSVPASASTVLFSIISAPLNALKSLANLPNVIFSSPVSAQSLAEQHAAINAFDITRYGYPLNHPALTADPEKYTPEFCSQAKEARLNSKYENEITGFEEYTKADPCLLELDTTEALCGLYVSSDTCDGSETGGSSPISGNSQDLARQILENDAIDLSASNFCRYCLEDIEHTANGRPAYDDVRLDVNLLRFLADLGNETSVDVNSISGAGCGHANNTCVSAGGDSNHYNGTAIDFGCSLDRSLADEIGSKYGIKRFTGESCPGDGHWHYSTTGN